MENRYQNRKIELLQDTVNDLKEVIGRLKKEEQELTTQRQEKEDRLMAWKQELELLTRPVSQSTPSRIKGRRPKGENLRNIRKYFEENGDAGHSVSEVSGALEIAWSSTHKTLQKRPDLFYFADNNWYLKNESKNGNGGREESLT